MLIDWRSAAVSIKSYHNWKCVNCMQIQNRSGETKSRGTFRAHPCNWVCLYLDWMAKHQLILHPLYRIVAHSRFVQVSGMSDLFIDFVTRVKEANIFQYLPYCRKLVCCIWLTLWTIPWPTSLPVVLLPMSWSGEMHVKIQLWWLREVLTLDNWHSAQVRGSMAGYGHDPREGFTHVAQHCSFNSSQGWGGGP